MFPMNILQVLPGLDLGGVETGVVDFCFFLKEQAHKPVVVSGGGRLTEELAKAGVRHYQLKVGRKSLFSVLFLIPLLRRIILEEKIDIVHARSRVPAWICYFASQNTPAKFITTAHGYYSPHFFSRIMSYGKYVICPSKIIAFHMEKDLHTPRYKIRIIPRGIDNRRFNFVPPEEKLRDFPRLVFLGRISPVKGVEYFVEAVKILTADYPSLKAEIVGEPGRRHQNYYNFLKKLVSKYGLDRNINFSGRKEANEAFSQADILILPSVVPEAFGRVIVEAQLAGVFVIATSLGAPAEIIEEGKTGLLVKAFDVNGISAAVARVIKDKEFYRRVVYQARERALTKYSLSLMAEETLKVYREALDKLNILVIKLSALGDVILGLVGIKALRQYFPHARLIVVTTSQFRDIFENTHFVDKVICVKKERSRWRQLWSLGKMLRSFSLDISVDFQNNTFSHLLSFLSFASQRYGWRRKCGFLLNHTLNYNKQMVLDPVESQAQLLSLLGVPIKDTLPDLKIDKSVVSYWRQQLETAWGRDITSVAVNIGSSPDWQTKDLRVDTWRKVIDYLIRQQKVGVIMVGADYLRKKAQAIKEGLESKYILNLCGRTSLVDLIALIKCCQLVITPDNAIFHISVALRKKTVVFFGPTDPRRHSLKSHNIIVLRRKDLGCLGCYRKRCRNWKCMDFGIDTIASAIDKGLCEREEQ